MNDLTFFLIIIVLTLIYYLPGKNNVNKNLISKPKSKSKPQSQLNSPNSPNLPKSQSPESQSPKSQSSEYQDKTQLILPTTSTYTPSALNTNIQQPNVQSQNIINEYLNENECDEKKEKFDTMGPNVNIGNNMNFQQQILPNSSSDLKSLVPDFEPNYLNINSELNSYGYATTNPETSEYYKARGFMNPSNGEKFADSVSYMLAHPYQTRYCEKQN